MAFLWSLSEAESRVAEVAVRAKDARGGVAHTFAPSVHALPRKGCPTRRVFRRVGTTDPNPCSRVTDIPKGDVLDVTNADQLASLPRRWIPSFRNHQLLSTKAPAGHSTKS